jgi:LPS export ABC transporter protein LptC
MLSVNSILKRPLPGRRKNFFLLLVLLMAAGAGFFSGCHNEKKSDKEPPAKGKKGQLPEEGWKIESLLSEAGQIKGKLTAPYMLRYQRLDSPYTEFPRTLHVDFFSDSLKQGGVPVVESRLDALYGKYFQNQSKVFLRDTVVVKNVLKGDTLHCQELWWDQGTSKFYTDKPVRIYTKDKILFGTGMEADQNFRWYSIRKLTGMVLTSQNALPK